MNLLLRIAGPGFSRELPLAPTAAEISVGRDAGADIALSDPEKWISRRHLALRPTVGGVEVRVVSTVNGVETSRGLLEPGQRAVLGAGDHLNLGAYRIDLAPAEASPDGRPGDAGLLGQPLPAAPSLGADDPFAALLGGASPAARNDDPFGLPEFRPRPTPRPPSDPFSALSGPAGRPAPPPSGPLGEFLNPGAAMGNGLLAPGAMGMAGGAVGADAPSLNDWLAHAEPGAAHDGGPLDDFLGRARAQAPRALSPDHVHSLHMPLPFGAPSAATPATSAIPAIPAPASAASISTPEPPSPPDGDVWADLLQGARGAVQPSAGLPLTPALPLAPSPAADDPAAIDDPFAELNLGGNEDAFSTWVQSSAPEPTTVSEASPPAPVLDPQAPLPPQAAPPATEADPPSTPEPDGTWSAFAEGLGVPPSLLAGEAEARRAGTMVKLLIEGLADLLSARADLRRELRAEDRTMLSGRDNNPLKLKLSADELVQYLFGTGAAGGYMPPERAVRQSIADLCVHEQATIAAARSAVEGALRDFDPVRLRKKFNRSKPGLFQMLDNAKLWDAYQHHYEQQTVNMADWLESVFSRHFTPTYSRETERLKAALKPGTPPPPAT